MIAPSVKMLSSKSFAICFSFSLNSGKFFAYTVRRFTMFNISVDEYFYPSKKAEKSTVRRQIDSSLDLLTDNELKIIQATIDGVLNSRENKQ